MENRFLLYGANGYTGELIARYAVEKGFSPILAGRNEAAVAALARELALEYCIFSLDKPEEIDQYLEKVPLVLHAAGPFVYTARPMMEACLRTRTHYLDIAGEIQAFELAASLGKRAADVGVLLMPGVGFDVVPTDCAAAYLKEQLPEAVQLELAFATKGSRLSRGTMLTMAENMTSTGAVRKNGKIRREPVGQRTKKVPFTDEYHWFSMSIPWGDVSTAYYTTGIPNIITYTAVTPKSYQRLKWMRLFKGLLKRKFVRNYVRNRIKKGNPGPTEAQRQKGRSFIWGQVSDAAGQQKAVRLNTPEGYALTVKASVLIIERIMKGIDKTGFYTPAGAFGADLIMEVDESVAREDI
jgi:short subunit dehydrogenase-like uncharacterized protein